MSKTDLFLDICMIPLYSKEEFKSAKAKDELYLKCERCGISYLYSKYEIQKCIKRNKGCCYCCMSCAKGNPSVQCTCSQCGLNLIRSYCDYTKNKYQFCSLSCSATYHNTHKLKGYKRSKLELFLEQELLKTYSFDFKFNSKEEIKSELDIYIPHLKLAFELNGIFHYEPIYGITKLEQTQNNDFRKFQACLEKGIELCIIDTSQLKNFKPEKAKVFLNIILTIINSSIERNDKQIGLVSIQ